MEDKKLSLSGSGLKIIALVTMLIDHVGAVIVQRTMSMPGFDHVFWGSVYEPLRQIGRLAFPIYCFLLVEGFLHTRNVKEYLKRLVIFALISEIPFNLAVTGNFFDLRFQNVFWELALGLVAMYLLSVCEKKKFPYWAQTVFRLIILTVFMLLAEMLCLDYGLYGILSIVVLYVCRQNRVLQIITGALSFSWEMPASFAFALIAFYNGKKGRSIKYVFYAFYPAHLLILYIIARAIGCPY